MGEWNEVTADAVAAEFRVTFVYAASITATGAEPFGESQELFPNFLTCGVTAGEEA
jgi:hypothetical protein